MFKNRVLILGVLAGLMFLLAPQIARAEGMCFCGTDLTKSTTNLTGGCQAVVDEAECIGKQSAGKDLSCQFFTGPEPDRGQTACKDAKAQWEASSKKTTATQSTFQGVSSKLIPECLLKNTLSPECRDVSIFVYFLIQLARYLFSIIGALALIMFVYGGFMMILSQGNSEKTKKGTEIIVAAVIGLIIMFGAYMLVSFLGETVNIQSQYQLK